MCFEIVSSLWLYLEECVYWLWLQVSVPQYSCWFPFGTLSNLGHSIAKDVLELFYTEAFSLLFQGKGLVWIAVKHFVFFLCHLKKKLDINISSPLCKFLLKFCILKWPLQVEWGFVPILSGSRFALNRYRTVMCSNILLTLAIQLRWCGWLSKLLLLCWKKASSASAEKYPAAKLELEAVMNDLKRLLPTDNCSWQDFIFP